MRRRTVSAFFLQAPSRPSRRRAQLRPSRPNLSPRATLRRRNLASEPATRVPRSPSSGIAPTVPDLRSRFSPHKFVARSPAPHRKPDPVQPRLLSRPRSRCSRRTSCRATRSPNLLDRPPGLAEVGDGNRASFGDGPAVELDSLNLVKCVRGEVGLTTVRTRHNGNTLDHEKLCSAAVAPCDAMHTSPALSADIAGDTLSRCHPQTLKTVMITKRGVALNFPTTLMAEPDRHGPRRSQQGGRNTTVLT